MSTTRISHIIMGQEEVSHHRRPPADAIENNNLKNDLCGLLKAIYELPFVVLCCGIFITLTTMVSLWLAVLCAVLAFLMILVMIGIVRESCNERNTTNDNMQRLFGKYYPNLCYPTLSRALLHWDQIETSPVQEQHRLWGAFLIFLGACGVAIGVLGGVASDLLEYIAASVTTPAVAFALVLGLTGSSPATAFALFLGGLTGSSLFLPLLIAAASFAAALLFASTKYASHNILSFYSLQAIKQGTLFFRGPSNNRLDINNNETVTNTNEGAIPPVQHLYTPLN